MSCNDKFLGNGISVYVWDSKNFVRTPFKFLEAGFNTGQQELDLFWSKVELYDCVILSGSVGIILNRNADEGV